MADDKTKRRGTIDAPTMDELRCLNSWPEGTRGHLNDEELISNLFRLCKFHGFGRMEQLMSAIHEIWRDPEKVQKWMEFREEMLKTIATCERESQQ